MRSALLVLLLSLAASASAQNPDSQPTLYTFALPNHPGRLHFDAPTFTIVQASAKPSGSEFGLRGDDASSGIHLLAFSSSTRKKRPSPAKSAAQPSSATTSTATPNCSP